MRIRRRMGALLAAFAPIAPLARNALAQTPPTIPWTAITISGSKAASGPAVTYRAYQAPG